MSKWSEIRNDFIDMNSNTLVVCVDAWLTDDDNEEGKTIARVIGKEMDNGIYYEVIYNDNDAITDEYAQEMIAEAKDIIKTEIKG